MRSDKKSFYAKIYNSGIHKKLSPQKKQKEFLGHTITLGDSLRSFTYEVGEQIDHKTGIDTGIEIKELLGYRGKKDIESSEDTVLAYYLVGHVLNHVYEDIFDSKNSRYMKWLREVFQEERCFESLRQARKLARLGEGIINYSRFGKNKCLELYYMLKQMSEVEDKNLKKMLDELLDQHPLPRNADNDYDDAMILRVHMDAVITVLRLKSYGICKKRHFDFNQAKLIASYRGFAIEDDMVKHLRHWLDKVFDHDDIKPNQIGRLALKWKNRGKSDSVSKYIYGRITKDSKSHIDEYEETNDEPPAILLDTLINELNIRCNDSSLYDDGQFPKDILNEKQRKILKEIDDIEKELTESRKSSNTEESNRLERLLRLKKGQTFQQLNCKLLEVAYPDEIVKRKRKSWKEKIDDWLINRMHIPGSEVQPRPMNIRNICASISYMEEQGHLEKKKYFEDIKSDYLSLEPISNSFNVLARILREVNTKTYINSIRSMIECMSDKKLCNKKSVISEIQVEESLQEELNKLTNSLTETVKVCNLARKK